MKPKVKPRLRGVSHEWGAYIAALAGIVLVVLAPTARAAWAAGIYSLSLGALLGISALYHRPTWKPDARAIMRRLDHSAIFILVAGTYTPLCMLVLGDRNGGFLLGLVWAGAGLGVAQSMFWPKAPKPLVALLCVALGWVAVWEWTPLTTLLSLQVLLFIGIGGILYTLGAIAYSVRRPDPWPEVFGYHEIFHALIVVAAVLHFTAVAQIVFEFGGAALASPARGESMSALDAAAVDQQPGDPLSPGSRGWPSLRSLRGGTRPNAQPHRTPHRQGRRRHVEPG
jgi:hemolysin III